MRAILALIAFFALLTVSACGGGGGGTPKPPPIQNQLSVGQITGQDSIAELQSSTFTISASGDSALAYSWSVSPSTIGTIQNSSSSTMTLLVAEIQESQVATIQVVVSAPGKNSVTRSKTIMIVNVEVGSAPEIHSVSPLSGVPQEQVVFQANVDGTTPLSYQWDFGGSATPNSSTLPSPSVTLGSSGTYACSVIVTNSAGQDTLNFNLTITPSSNPPELSEVRMSSFYSGTTCTFAVFGTGTGPFTFQWGFGGGASPNSSTSDAPVATLGAAGIYNGSVTVTNSAGSATLAFTYQVYMQVSNIFELLDGNSFLVAQDGTYLGLISSNSFLTDSIMNQFGTYGSSFSSKSIFNDFGTYGSEFSYQSPWNQFASSPPLIFIGDIFVAYLTTNIAIAPRINPYELVLYLSS